MSNSNLEVSREEKDENETEDKLELQFKELKEWLINQEHLPVDSISDSLLYHFAAAAKGNNEKACKRLDAYYTVRRLIPEFFSQRDPSGEDITKSAKCLLSGFLPDVTLDGNRVFMISLLDTDPALFDLVAYQRRYYMLFDYYLVKNVIKPGQGVYFLIDAKGATISHLMKISPSVTRKTVFCTQDVYPIKLNGIIYLNINELTRMTLSSVVIPLFREKLRKRIHILGSQYDKLYKLIPREILPPEYGGEGPSVKEINDKNLQDIIQDKAWFLNEGSISVNESKRIGKSPISLPGCRLM